MYYTLVNLGALTSKVSAYKYRSWELETKGVLDFFDSLGVIGLACIKGLTILRMLPQSNNLFDWISDKFRFSFDSLLENRNLRILYKQEEISLVDSLHILARNMFLARNILFFFGKTLDLFDGFLIKKMNIFYQRVDYIFDSFFNINIVNLDERVFTFIKLSDISLYSNLVNWGLFLRLEFPLLEVLFEQKINFENKFSVGVNEAMLNLGNNLLLYYITFFNGVSLLSKTLLKKSSLILGGLNLYSRIFLSNVQKFISDFFITIQSVYMHKFLKYIPLNSYMSEINMLELGLVSKTFGGVYKNIDLVFSIDTLDLVFFKKPKFIVSFEAYTDRIFGDLVFPITLNMERDIVSTNIQGILTYCETVVGSKLKNVDIWMYFNSFKNLLKYNFILCNTLMQKLFFKNLINIKFISFFFKPEFLHLFRNVIIQTNKTKNYINQLFKFNIENILQNTTLNYYYTHKMLMASPTILLADARIYNKKINFK